MRKVGKLGQGRADRRGFNNRIRSANEEGGGVGARQSRRQEQGGGKPRPYIFDVKEAIDEC